MNTNTDEIEIDLWDLFKNIAKKWKEILLVTIAGIVIAVPFALPKEKPTVESLKSSLDTDRAEYVEGIYDDYQAAQDKEKIIKENIENSAIMKLDGYNVPRTDGTYIISSNVPEAWRLYPSLLRNDSFITQAADILGLSDSSEVSDLLYFSGYSSGANTLTEQESICVMNITAYGYSLEEAKQMQQLISKSIETRTEALNMDGITLSLNNIEWTYAEGADDSILKAQQQLTQTKASAALAVTNFQDNEITKLSEEEKTYFNALDGKIESPSAQPKKVVIGAFLGLFLAMLFYALRYVMAGVVHTENDAEILYGTTSYGVIRKKTAEQDIAMITAQINTQISTAKASTLFIQTNDDNKEVLNKIKNNLDNVTIHSGDITNDPDSYQNFVSSNLAIAITTISKTKTKHIEKIHSLSSIAKKEITGVIVLEDF